MKNPDQEKRTVAPDGRPEAVQPDWRRDFPIDTEQDNYVARRDFTRFLGLTSLGFVVGQLWIAFQSWLRQRRGEPPAKAIAQTKPDATGRTELPVLRRGEALTCTYPDENETCLLLWPADASEPVAYNQHCTHLSCAVVPEIKDGCLSGQLHCPCHRGVFDAATGRPIAGPPRRPLTRITLEIRDGIIYATRPEPRTV
jgi:Rieske Fe-S protein